MSRTETRAKVRFPLEEGLFVSEIADVLQIARPTVCYHKRKLGYEMRDDYGQEPAKPRVATASSRGSSTSTSRARADGRPPP